MYSDDFCLRGHTQHSLVLVWKHLHKSRQYFRPIIEDHLCASAAREFRVAFNEHAQPIQVIVFNYGFQID